ncbi:unnamed protein product [Lathyrus sativus]|nr:unnamed protein product [Lathyrus sativus]
MLPPNFKKGPGRPKKLRWKEHDETGSRMRRPGVAYRCTRCDQFGNNYRKCQSTLQDTNALKRKRKTHRTKGETSSNTNTAEPSVEKTPVESTKIAAEPSVEQAIVDPTVEPIVEDPFYDPKIDDIIENTFASQLLPTEVPFQPKNTQQS